MSHDTTVTIDLGNGENEMAQVDLPENVAGNILQESSQGFTALMGDIRHNGANVHNLVRTYAAKSFGHLDTIEARAHSGVIATPVASPTVQQ